MPWVARRSPAITTPSANVSATMVVPCTTSAGECPDVGWPSTPGAMPSGKRTGSRWGAWAATKSVNDEGPGARYAPRPLGGGTGEWSMVGWMPLLGVSWRSGVLRDRAVRSGDRIMPDARPGVAIAMARSAVGA